MNVRTLLLGVLMAIPPVIPNGAKADGVADDRQALFDANGFAVGLRTDLRLAGGTYRIGSDLDLDMVVFMPGAELAPDGGVTATVDIPLSFGLFDVPLPAETGVVNPYYPYGDVRRYGAVGDGTTDNLTAINNASASVDAMLGGIVFFPPGTFGVSSTVVIPNRVAFVGSGRDIGPTATAANGHGTILSALPSFPHDTPLVQLADGSAQAFGCRAQNLSIHCNAIPGSIGVLSSVAQEQSGLAQVVIRGYMATGIAFTDASTALFNDNFLVSDVEVFCDVTATGSNGFVWSSLNGGMGLIQRISVNGKNTGALQGIAIHVVNGDGASVGRGNLIVQSANIERHDDGIVAESGTLLMATGVSGVSSGGGTNVVRLENGSRSTLAGLYRATGAFTNTIQDNVAGLTVTDQIVLQYVQGSATKVTPVVPLTDASTIAIDASLSEAYTVTLTGNHTMGTPGRPRSGRKISITVLQDGTGGWTLGWTVVYKQAWSDTGNAAGKRSTISFVYDGTNWNQDGAQSPYI